MERICGFCQTVFKEETNNSHACRFHPKFYFPFDRDKDGFHRKGWQCCDSEDRMAPGCTVSPHRDDVRKQYRPNSIMYDYVLIDPKTTKEN